jgi:hypothetical protein
MSKFGKFTVAAVLCLVMTLALLTTGAFARSANHSLASQTAHTTAATVTTQASWWGGGWGGLGLWGLGWGGFGGWWGGFGGCGCCGGFWW